MRNFKIVSYYTENTGYEGEVINLISSIDKLNRHGHDIDYYIRGINNLKNWSLNTRYKAVFIKELLEKYKIPLVFVDADATIEEYPILFDTLDCDISAHYRKSHKTILSGTIFVKPNQKIFKMLDEWINLNNTNSVLEQKNLEKAINNGKNYDLNWHNLPFEYVQIFDAEESRDKPFIKHWQASRKFRKKV